MVAGRSKKNCNEKHNGVEVVILFHCSLFRIDFSWVISAATCRCAAGLFLFIADQFGTHRAVSELHFVPYAPSEQSAAAGCDGCGDIDAETCLRPVPLLAVSAIGKMSVQAGIFITRNTLIVLRFHFKIYQFRFNALDRFRRCGSDRYWLVK